MKSNQNNKQRTEFKRIKKCCVYIDELRFVGTLATRMVSECALGTNRWEFMKTTRIQLLWNTTEKNRFWCRFCVCTFFLLLLLPLIIPFLISIRLLWFFFRVFPSYRNQSFDEKVWTELSITTREKSKYKKNATTTSN